MGYTPGSSYPPSLLSPAFLPIRCNCETNVPLDFFSHYCEEYRAVYNLAKKQYMDDTRFGQRRSEGYGLPEYFDRYADKRHLYPGVSERGLFWDDHIKNAPPRMPADLCWGTTKEWLECLKRRSERDGQGGAWIWISKIGRRKKAKKPQGKQVETVPEESADVDHTGTPPEVETQELSLDTLSLTEGQSGGPSRVV